MDFKEINKEYMEKPEQYIQSEDIRNVYMNELGAIAKKLMEV